jgi:hypothetical protein
MIWNDPGSAVHRSALHRVREKQPAHGTCAAPELSFSPRFT